jgi:dihydroxyacetone kinase-like predicted kinase
MDEQHQDFLEMQKQRAPAVDIATVAVVVGDGLADVFKSLGATAIVPGGQTMNPSTKDILQAVNNVASDKVIVLPNNKNVVLTAEQVQSLTKKRLWIILFSVMLNIIMIYILCITQSEELKKLAGSSTHLLENI